MLKLKSGELVHLAPPFPSTENNNGLDQVRHEINKLVDWASSRSGQKNDKAETTECPAGKYRGEN